MEVINYEEFKPAFIEAINSVIEEQGISAEVSTVTSLKTNESLDSLCVRFDGSSVAPNVPIGQLYESYLDSGESMKEFATSELNRLNEAYRRFPSLGFNASDINESYVRENIYFKLMNREMNEDICKSSPVLPFGDDLVLVPYVSVFTGEEESAAFRFTNNLRDNLRMTDDEVLKFARMNNQKQEYVCSSMTEMVKPMMMADGIPEDVIDEMMPDDEPMFVLTNIDKQWGAAAMASPDALQKAQERMGTDKFFIIPSSVHELILVPESKVSDPADLKAMCEDVNGNQSIMKNCDILSSNIYRFNGQKVQLCNSLSDLKQQMDAEKEILSEVSHIGRRMK